MQVFQDGIISYSATNQRKITYWATLLFILLTLSVEGAYSQSEPDWQPPVNLSADILNDTGLPASSREPFLAADSWGSVHAVWITDSDVGEFDSSESLYYARWKDGKWSEPENIMYSSTGGLWQPRIAADEFGWLHLVVIRSGELNYSRAPVLEADLAPSWIAPLVPTNLNASDSTLGVDSIGAVHIAFCSNVDEGYLAYIRSEDSIHWSTPLEPAESAGCRVRLSIDDVDRIHLVYSEQPGSGPGTGVYYLRSSDGGGNWTEQLAIDGGKRGYDDQYGPSWPNILAVGEDQIHILWDGQPAGQRWHQWSNDGGLSWSEPGVIDDLHRGLTEPNGLAVDSGGVVHLLTLGWLDTNEFPNGPFYTYWNDGEWAPLSIVTERSDWDAEGPSLTVVNGNQLLATWRHMEGSTNEAWASSLTLDAPAISPDNVGPPVVIEQPSFEESEQTAEEQATDQPSVTPNQRVFAEDSDNRFNPLIDPVLIAALAAGLFLAIALFVARRLAGRKRLR